MERMRKIVCDTEKQRENQERRYKLSKCKLERSRNKS